MFVLTYQILPATPFGAPDNSGAVPIRLGETISLPKTDPRTGLITGHGSLASFRPTDEAIRLTLKLDGISATIEDNYVTLECDAADAPTALKACEAAMHRFLLFASPAVDVAWRRQLLQMLDVQGDKMRRIPLHQARAGTTSFHVYDLRNTRAALEGAAAAMRHADERAIKSAAYIDHARRLMDMETDDALEEAYVASDVFGALYKSVAVIVGDPTKDRGDYQRRYKEIGLPDEFWKENVEWMRRVRNDNDVAHYDLGSEKLTLLRDQITKAVRIAREVLQVYLQHLAAR